MTTAKNIYKILIDKNWSSTVIATPKKIAQHISDLREYHSRSGESKIFTIETVRPVSKGEVLRFKVI